MSDANNDTSHAGLLLRTVPSDSVKFLFPIGPVKAHAFFPTELDVDGISLFVESSSLGEDGRATPDALLKVSGNTRIRDYGGVVSLEAEQIQQLGLSLEDTPSPLFNDHRSIPEMSRHIYDLDKGSVKNLALQLSRLAIIRILPKPIPKSPPSASE